MKFYTLIFFISLSFFFTGCEDEEGEEGTTTATSGWHFQGRDCQACHNVDLGVDKNLVVAGTLFKSATVANVDDLANSCNADMAIEFVDAGFNVVYSTASAYVANSNGINGQGNVFLLDRLYNSILNGTYTVRVVDRLSGSIMAQSLAPHAFSGAAYDITNADDDNNRLSCNACHDGGLHNGIVVAPLWTNVSNDLCK